MTTSSSSKEGCFIINSTIWHCHDLIRKESNNKPILNFFMLIAVRLEVPKPIAPTEEQEDELLVITCSLKIKKTLQPTCACNTAKPRSKGLDEIITISAMSRPIVKMALTL
jgi:hypothetical protein